MIDKIEIQTSNSKHMTDISMLVDKLDFLEEIEILRGKWHITELYRIDPTHNYQKSLDIDNIICINITDTLERKKRMQEFNEDIDKLLYKFNRGRNFRKVIEYALLTNLVPEGIYKSCYFDIVTINEPEDIETPERYQYVIVVSPRTELQELEQAFKEFKKFILKKIKFENRKHLKEATLTEEDMNYLYDIQKEILQTSDILASKSQPSILEEKLAQLKYNNYSAEKIDLIRSKLPLIYDEKYDKELIDKYIRGGMYRTANMAEFDTLKTIDIIRDIYWIRNKNFFNGAGKKISFPESIKMWQEQCPFYKATKIHDVKDKPCKYCSFDKTINTIETQVNDYVKRLEQS